jgi:hypothetical protein
VGTVVRVAPIQKLSIVSIQLMSPASGNLRAPVTEEVIRRIEKALGVDFGVSFNE